MHAGFPLFLQEVNGVFRLGAREARIDGLLERAGGTLLARGMATLLKVGFGFVMRLGLFDRRRAAAAEEFFRENFEIRDPEAANGIRYYQGKILVRTEKPEDDMNVYLRFCPRPEALYRGGPLGSIQKRIFGSALNSGAVVSAEVLNEKDAARLQADPDKVDLVISFRDVQSIVGLVGRPKLDMGSLLIENIVQMKGNVGHLFKFGAIAKNIELALAHR